MTVDAYRQHQKWTKAELARLRRLYPSMDNERIAARLHRSYISIMQMGIKLRLRKSPEFMASAICRFQKGATPWNLGKTGYMGANRTSFRKGNYSKRWNPEDYLPGALRICKDGSLEMKVAEGVWQSLARYVWETERGPIPESRVVRFRNGDQHDTRIENLRLGTRPELMRENSYHRYPKEIARLIQLRGALQRQINKREVHG